MEMKYHGRVNNAPVELWLIRVLYLEKDKCFLSNYYFIKVFDHSENTAQIYYRGGTTFVKINN